ncbi:glucose-6-phosphate 1-dehydrogenase-like [Coccinella septempunctata]|uniref:glucose-6-phosphate 1-dehydrogenase-like n=1 Tax=Coccinella septempunctata TaxID=41139 RepID=UPI001D07C682|nr:glucose-6-phosphate 1-dehydrogenase-like [Coccinella septempunctata]
MADANQEQELNHHIENDDGIDPNPSDCYVFVVIGATGNFAVNCLLPSLWLLYKHGYLPPNTTVIGFSRKEFTNKAYAEKVCPYFRHTQAEKGLIQCFFSHVIYFRGSCDNRSDVQELNSKLEEIGRDRIMHIFYHLSLPPNIYEICTQLIKQEAMSKSGKTRIAIEQPFAQDLMSFRSLRAHMISNFDQDQIFLQDHYLGKEMILSIFSLRFGNTLFEKVWDRNSIASVLLNIEEKSDLSKGNTFDKFGIIKSEIMTHMMQMIALIAMAKPSKFNTEFIRKAKLKLLSQVTEIKLDNVVLGQYVGNPEGTDEERESYREHLNIDEDTLTPTFAVVVVFIRNDTWKDVPFICKCGRAMKDSKQEIRIQFKETKDSLFSTNLMRNELVIHFDPGASIHLKMVMKAPGMEHKLDNVLFTLSYSGKHMSVKLPNSFARLLFEMLCEKRMNFVTFEEINEVFRVFTPVLKEIEDNHLEPLPYIRGGNGPLEAAELINENNYLDRDHRMSKTHKKHQSNTQ